ncbi:MAG: hypothetical protein PHG66_05100 [Candidatus Colwellbacteria bacterium]|nr:hypothetical protein [Candidatus Colwellbacteria bacterium]
MKKYLWVLIIVAISAVVAALLFIGRSAEKRPPVPENVAHKDALSETESDFNEVGNLVLTESGWRLVYEKPGAPALTADLIFYPYSSCGSGICSPALLKAGERVLVEGKSSSGRISVVSLVATE